MLKLGLFQDLLQAPHYSNYNLYQSKGIILHAPGPTTIFTVEAGTEFFLKLVLVSKPLPDKLSFQRDWELFQSQPLDRAIEIGLDFVRIPIIQKSHEGRYTISSSNNLGEGKFCFQLKVVGMYEQLESIGVLQ